MISTLWRIDDAVWERMEPMLPPRKAHRYGSHNPRIPDRAAMEAILVVLAGRHSWATIARVKQLSTSSIYRRYREWAEAGVIDDLVAAGLIDPVRRPPPRMQTQ